MNMIMEDLEHVNYSGVLKVILSNLSVVTG